MRPSFLPQPLVWLLLATTACGQKIEEGLSFGHKSTLNQGGRNIPGWNSRSTNHNLQILSDRAILTPPGPGNAKGALWTEKPIDSDTWTIDVNFRASGQDTGSGSLQIWYAKQKDPIFIDSLYTVSNFDGLLLVIDQYGGTGGKIRGFLNDGSLNFRQHKSLESLAFGHCDYSYRNLGRPSNLKVSSKDGLTVSIDDKLCFHSDKIALPSSYYFGATAATGDQPDSFELHKFVVTSSIPHNHEPAPKGDEPRIKIMKDNVRLQKMDKLFGAPEFLQDKQADEIKGQQDQFADLHNRLQGLTHQLANVMAEFESIGQKLDEGNARIMGKMPASFPTDKIDALGRRMENLERNVEQVKRDVEGKDYRDHLNQLNQAIESVRGGLADGLPENIGKLISASAPRMGMFVFIVLAVQIMLAGAYILYKKRRASMPKKYL